MPFKVIDQFPFEFYGNYFTVALANDRKLYVPMQALCDAMGLQTHGQVRRLREGLIPAGTLGPWPTLWLT